MSAYIELDDLRPKHMDLPTHWNDWYFTVTFSDEGKDYFLVMAITEGTFMGGSGCSIGFCQDPFSPVQEGDAQVVGEPVNHIGIGKLLPQNAFNYTEEKGTIKVEMEKLRAVYGKEMDITGRGVCEHVWIKALEFMKIRTMDWTYLNFDQLYAFFCHCESISDDGTPYHFEDGVIYLLDGEDCFVTRKIEFVPEAWVYMKPYRRFIPSQQKVTVQTQDGVSCSWTRPLIWKGNSRILMGTLWN